MTTDPGLGFAEPALDGQANFRGLLDAMARPGTIHELTALPADADVRSGLALTLFDHDTPIWLDGGAAALKHRLAFHCGCPFTDRSDLAMFALLTEGTALRGLDRFCLGDPEYPDRSTTVICELPGLSGGPELRLSGPGINGQRTFAPLGLPEGFPAEWAANGARYPLGVDLILTSGTALAALPRTCQIEEVG
ncbi:MAG: phosphonate C-P lyase system protein PhnH [Pseudomonadota bacterium]